MDPKARQRLIEIRDHARSLQIQGRLVEAFDAHREALALAPDVAPIWMSSAQLAYALGLQELALPQFEEAARLDPSAYAAVEAARRLSLGLGLKDRAERHSDLAHALQPSVENRLSRALVVPSIIESDADIDLTRQRYEAALDAMLAARDRFAEPPGALGIAGFFLAYHGRNDKDLQIKAARAYRHLVPGLDWVAPHCRAVGRRPGRIRVGFISRFFCSHSICSTSRGLIEKINRDRFEIFALRIMPSIEDEATRAVAAAADHLLVLDPDVYRAREQIAGLELDILFYQDIGMEQTSYFLAFSRLAHVQCVSFGHPNTTGIPNMDYFVSNDLFETLSARDQYSERLFLLHDLPTLAYYYEPAVPDERPSRDALGLPSAATLYLCPQTLFKLHPDFDELIGGILTRDPDGLVVLIEGQIPEFAAQLRQRFARTIAHVMQRIIFVPRRPKMGFHQLLAAADVILDTVHFNGMNSSMESLAMGTPVVTLPSDLQRGRHTQAMYRKMGIADCIARSADDYVDIAVRIGTDADYAAALRRRILVAKHVLFEDGRVVTEFERFFVHALRTYWGERQFQALYR